MKIHLPAIAAVLAASLAPAASQAASPEAALDACVKAFSTTYLPGHPIKTTKAVNPPSSPTLTLLQPTEYSIALSARGVTSGKVLAEARCIANGKGIVVVLDSPASTDYIAKADFVVSLR